MRKPILRSITEVEKCEWVCDYCSENAGACFVNAFFKSGPRLPTGELKDPVIAENFQ